MTHPRSALHIAFAVTVLLGLTAPLRADVTVTGVTYKITTGGKYEPLGGVVIQAYRAGPLLRNPVVSADKTGAFEFTVPDGEPFDISFHGDDRVPELTQIAGNQGGKNTVNIALYTAEQYKHSYHAERVSLKTKLECTLKQLPRDSDAARATAELLRKER